MRSKRPFAPERPRASQYDASGFVYQSNRCSQAGTDQASVILPQLRDLIQPVTAFVKQNSRVLATDTPLLRRFPIPFEQNE